MKIDIWSDFACPWCYIGEKRLQKAIEDLGMEKEVTIRPRAFELDPYAPQTPEMDAVSRLVKKYQIPQEEAVARIQYIEKTGKAEGIDFHLMGAQYTNTFDSHRLMKLALSKDNPKIIDKINILLFEAFFNRNLQLSSHEVLVDVGKNAGLDEQEILDMLNSELFTEEVREDELEALAKNIKSVPFFAFEDGSGIPGAASYEDFKKALEMARQPVDGASCGPKGCLLPD